MYNFLIIIGLLIAHFNDIPFAIVMGVVCFMMEIKAVILLFYCDHLFSCISDLKRLKMDETFENVDSMMNGINMI